MTYNVLLVENDFSDIRLIEEVAAELKVKFQLQVVNDGEQAMAYLRQEPPYAGQPRPDLILLDLKIPKKPGQQVLSEVKQDPELKRIPVIVLSTSESARDIMECYDLHTNCYIIKPANLDDFIEVLRSIDTFWFKIVALPPGNR